MKCKEPFKIPEQVLKDIGYKAKLGSVFYHGKGCDACRQTGYRGRMGILETMMIDDTIRDMLIRGASSYEIKQHAIKENHMTTLWEDALSKFTQGLTTLEEVLRVSSAE